MSEGIIFSVEGTGAEEKWVSQLSLIRNHSSKGASSMKKVQNCKLGIGVH